MIQTIQIIVTGKVQGVFYRQGTKEKARELGVTGHVENLADGNVKIIATGTREQLDSLINWSKQGPPKAKVEKTEISDQSLQLFEKFTVIRY